jgi:hypothetical protein
MRAVWEATLLDGHHFIFLEEEKQQPSQSVQIAFR